MYTPEGKPPQDIWLVNAPIDEAAGCIMSGMDATMINKIDRSNDIKHQVKVVAAGSLYEITMEGPLSRYIVQLIKVDSSTTKVLLQSPPAWGSLLSVAAEHCSDARRFVRYGT